MASPAKKGGGVPPKKGAPKPPSKNSTAKNPASKNPAPKQPAKKPPVANPLGYIDLQSSLELDQQELEARRALQAAQGQATQFLGRAMIQRESDRMGNSNQFLKSSASARNAAAFRGVTFSSAAMRKLSDVRTGYTASEEESQKNLTQAQNTYGEKGSFLADATKSMDDKLSYIQQKRAALTNSNAINNNIIPKPYPKPK